MGDKLTLSARLDVSTAGGLVDALKSRAHGDLTLDAADVTHFGALGLQAVLSAARDADAEGRKLKLINLDSRVRDQIAAMGCDPDNLTERAP